MLGTLFLQVLHMSTACVGHIFRNADGRWHREWDENRSGLGCHGSCTVGMPRQQCSWKPHTAPLSVSANLLYLFAFRCNDRCSEFISSVDAGSCCLHWPSMGCWNGNQYGNGIEFYRIALDLLSQLWVTAWRAWDNKDRFDFVATSKARCWGRHSQFCCKLLVVGRCKLLLHQHKTLSITSSIGGGGVGARVASNSKNRYQHRGSSGPCRLLTAPINHFQFTADHELRLNQLKTSFYGIITKTTGKEVKAPHNNDDDLIWAKLCCLCLLNCFAFPASLGSWTWTSTWTG